MTGRNKAVHGSVAIVTCRACQASLPVFEFEVESDADAAGFCSASKCNGLEVVIAETTLKEWKAMQSGELSTLPLRLSGFSDFHVLHIKRIENNSEPPKGISFAEFMDAYKPPTIIYACPCCSDGEAIETQALTTSEFEAMGGRIIALDELIVGH